MKKGNATIYDVAQAAGVSLATVSRVINKSDQVKPETQKKVLAVIEKLGYRPNAVAQGLASKKTTTVGVYVPEFTRLSIAQILQGINDVSHMYNYSILIESDPSTNSEDHFWDSFMKKQVDGVLVVSDELTDEDVNYFKKDPNVPVVLVSTHTNNDIASVGIDYKDATYTVVKELIERGRKEIAFVGTSIDRSVNRLKEEGYTKAINEYQLKSNIIKVENSFTKTSERALEVVEQYDAIVATRDSLAVAFVNAAASKGINIPEQIEIVGFDDTKYARMARPQLSSVSYSTYNIGAVAMRLLTKLMNKEQVEETNVILPYTIKKRESTK